MSDSNKALVQRFYAEVWNEHNPGATGQYYAVDFVDHDPAIPGQPAGAEGASQVFAGFIAAFPDIHFSIDFQVAEGEVVATRWSSTGTNSGSMMGMPPTGKAVSVTGIDIFRIAGGKIAERWGNFDMAGLMQQLGVGPA
jgi:steroid delta-isomerase-like uncharacterized protein